MSRVSGSNTGPEITVRKIIHRMGLRFRLHQRNLPGNPDIVLPRLKKIVFVNGCFWHGHRNCARAKRPSTNTEFWNVKIEGNIARDRKNEAALTDMGWQVLVVWSCETKRPKQLFEKLDVFLNDKSHSRGGGPMARSLEQHDPESVRVELIELLRNFELELSRGDLRSKVLSLVPAHSLLNKLGSSLIPHEQASSARDRIINYLLRYPLTIISGSELMVVGGIGEWARRVRELRVEFGWQIVSGSTAKEMDKEGEFPLDVDVATMCQDDYLLLNVKQDRDAAFRWNKANEIRKRSGSIQSKVLEYLRLNVGIEISGEELRYVSNNKSEWARRVRELRTEQGWPIATKTTGMPDLPIGVYVLAEDKQAPEHDRKIPDHVRRAVLQRDDYKCQSCAWHQEKWNPADPRHLEAHHLMQHVKGGANTEENLVTLCNICHDRKHTRGEGG